MKKITVYVMQPYWQARKHLAPGVARQFATPEEAQRAGERAATNGLGVGALVMRQTVEPEFDVWSEPEVIWRAGTVPA